MNAYSANKNITSKSIRFAFDGIRIDENSTPEELGMEDDDIIDVMKEQTGGFYC